MSPHIGRPLIRPELKSNFKEVFEAIYELPNQTIVNLKTKSGILFDAKAAESKKVGKFILFTHDNRVYPCCWGNSANHMGKTGQRISQYVKPLDEWFQNIKD